MGTPANIRPGVRFLKTMTGDKKRVDTISIWSVVKGVILVAGAIYIALVILLTLFQSRMIYYPTSSIDMTPRYIDLDYDEVDFVAVDDVKLNGWFIPKEDHIGVLLFCHGNAGNISHRLETIRIFHDLGLSVFIFDYRGYGQSQGKLSEKGTYLDVEAAWRYLTEIRMIKPSDIIVFGRSLGGSIAAYIAKEENPGALILESAMTSVPDVAAKIYPFLPVRLLARFEYNTIDYVREVSCPVLVIHSPDDEIIPYENGRRLFEAANEPKRFLELTGGHNEGFMLAGDYYSDGLQDFLSQYRD